MKTEELLEQRGKTHGDYSDHARCTQAILRAMQAEKNWNGLPDEIKESVHMIAHKLGRIATGNPYVKDHYDDIAGYSVLVAQRVLDGVGMRPRQGVAQASPQPLVRDVQVRTASITFPGPPTAFVTGMTAQVLPQNSVNPVTPGPEGTEPQDASHSVERKVPRHCGHTGGVHLTDDHLGMFFRLADGNLSPVRLDRNDGPEPERYPFKAHGKRYTEYGFVAGDDGNPLHDIVAFHPH